MEKAKIVAEDETDREHWARRYFEIFVAVTGNARQKEFFQWQAEAVQAVEISTLDELPEIKASLKGTYKIQPKRCYGNSFYVALTSGRLEYVHGYVKLLDLPLLISHAFLYDPETGEYYDATFQGRPNNGERHYALFKVSIDRMLYLSQRSGGYAGGEEWVQLYYDEFVKGQR